MTPIFFSDPSLFRKWLEENHQKETEIQVGYYKLSARKPTMTWSESVDQALCFGWIDGIRRSIDHESYTNRFTPRKSNSLWSAINIKKIEVLTKAGLMHPSGLDSFNHRDRSKDVNEVREFSLEFEKIFKNNSIAWDFFHAQAPSYRKIAIHLIMTAKQEKTRISRLEKLIEASLNSKRIL